MTIEIQRPGRKYQFKQGKDDAREVWYKRYKRGTHWRKLETCATPDEARQRVLRLREEGEK